MQYELIQSLRRERSCVRIAPGTQSFLISYGMSKIENELSESQPKRELREQLEYLGIKAVLFDLDDTLIYTSEIFAKYMREYVEKVEEETGISQEVIDESLRRINDEEYKKMGVCPARWETVVNKMVNEFVNNEESIVNNLEILMKIYTEKPRIRPGARAILEGLKATGVKIGLVTHANVDWTWRKIASTGIIDYFDSILIADENGHKSAKHWESVMLNLGVIPSECLVVGDSLSGDVIPPSELGARTVWLNKGSTWSVYRTGEVPETTLVIDEVGELLTAIDCLR
jgi:putative hydrolase of the HAD superfamily